MIRLWRWPLGLLLGLLLVGGACAPTPVIPTLMVLPSLTFSPVPTVTRPPATPTALPTAAPLPTASPVPTATPTFPAPSTPTVPPVAGVTINAAQLVQGLGASCTPQTAEVRVLLAGPVGEETQVLLKWDYEGLPTSRLGLTLAQVSPHEFRGTLGPFERAQPVVYRAIVLQGRAEQLSDEFRLEIAACDVPTPGGMLSGAVTRTPTPTPAYGAELSVQAANQTLTTAPDTPLQVPLVWTGGVPPYTISRVSQPRYGTLDGVGPARVYLPSSNFRGIDGFTFVITDGNAQASTGTIMIYVGVDPPTPAP